MRRLQQAFRRRAVRVDVGLGLALAIILTCIVLWELNDLLKHASGAQSDARSFFSAIAAAWVKGDRDSAERAVSDAMIDASSVAGTAEDCRERIEAYRQSGIDLPILSPFARGPGAKARFEAVIRACAPANA